MNISSAYKNVPVHLPVPVPEIQKNLRIICGIKAD
jgi:hypothetical protein